MSLMNSSKSDKPGLMSRPYVLLVDDDIDQLAVFKILLEKKAACNVLTARCAREAEETLKELHVDLVVCDINMPGCSGIELISRIRKAHDQSHLPVISFTADSEHHAEEAIANGADAFCYKSESGELVKTIDSIVETNRNSQALLQQIRDRFEGSAV